MVYFSMKECTCLIPFYNEGERLIYTLRELSKVKSIKEIICVNDGSDDNSLDLINTFFPNIKVINTTVNRGKSAAIGEGLSHVNTELVMMFDADLSNIKTEEIDNALYKMQQSNSIDMIILRRVVESSFLSLIRHDIVMSGQRILKVDDLKKVLDTKPKKYEIEMAINVHMMKSNKEVYWMPITTKNLQKITKFGFIKSFRLYIDAITGYFTYDGFFGYLKQIFYFCHKQA